MQALKAGFTALMTCESARVQQAVQQLVQRLQQQQQEQQQGGGTADQRTGLARRLAQKEALALRLNSEFPGDVGVLSCFFFNLVSTCFLTGRLASPCQCCPNGWSWGRATWGCSGEPGGQEAYLGGGGVQALAVLLVFHPC